jgi:hypothetical protein
MALCLLRYPGLIFTATGALEDINTTIIYINFLFKKKEWLQNNTDKVICFTIYI